MPAPDKIVHSMLDIPMCTCCILTVGITVKTKLQIDRCILDQWLVFLIFIFLGNVLEEILRNSTILNLNICLTYSKIHFPGG